jgi:hypothetical protein
VRWGCSVVLAVAGAPDDVARRRRPRGQRRWGAAHGYDEGMLAGNCVGKAREMERQSQTVVTGEVGGGTPTLDGGWPLMRLGLANISKPQRK